MSDQSEEVRQLREYVLLLCEQISRLTGIAYAHGWRGDEDLWEKAQPLRDALGYNDEDSDG